MTEVTLLRPRVRQGVRAYLFHVNDDGDVPCPRDLCQRNRCLRANPEREFFIGNLLVRIHLIMQMIVVDRPCAIGV